MPPPAAPRIDAHIHQLPPLNAAELAAFRVAEPYWDLLLADRPGHRSVQGWADTERLLADMDRAGIDRVVVQGPYLQQHALCVERNTMLINLMRTAPDRIIGFAALQPLAGTAALTELQRCRAAGMQGVGELNPYAQRHTLDHPAFLRLVEACIAADLPLNLHVSEAVGPFYPGKSATPPEAYYELACRYPELKLILAHWGGGLLFYEQMPAVRKQLRNVWYDTAASPLLYPTATIFDVALRCAGPHKILYGSDYPLLLYPRRSREPDFRPFLHEIAALGLEPAAHQAILGGNMAHLLGLVSPAIPTPAMPADHPPLPLRRVSETTPLSMLLEAWPQTRAILARHGRGMVERAIPLWEPLGQAAAACGLGADARRRLIAELNDAIASYNEEP